MLLMLCRTHLVPPFHLVPKQTLLCVCMSLEISFPKHVDIHRVIFVIFFILYAVETTFSAVATYSTSYVAAQIAVSNKYICVLYIIVCNLTMYAISFRR